MKHIHNIHNYLKFSISGLLIVWGFNNEVLAQRKFELFPNDVPSLNASISYYDNSRLSRTVYNFKKTQKALALAVQSKTDEHTYGNALQGAVNETPAASADAVLALEVCNNGVDDDGDGLVDCDDPDCQMTDFTNLSFSTVSVSGSNTTLSARYPQVGYVGSTQVDVLARIVSQSNSGHNHEFTVFGNDLIFRMRRSQTSGQTTWATVQYTVVQTGTNTPVAGDFKFFIGDLDHIVNDRQESIQVSLADLSGYALSITPTTTISTATTSTTITFTGSQDFPQTTVSPPEFAVLLTFANTSSFK